MRQRETVLSWKTAYNKYTTNYRLTFKIVPSRIDFIFPNKSVLTDTTNSVSSQKTEHGRIVPAIIKKYA